MKLSYFLLARPQARTSVLTGSSREMRENGYLRNLQASERFCTIIPELRGFEDIEA